MDWIVDVLDQWVTEIRPLFAPGKHPALFVTERAGRMSLRGLNVAFSQASEAASLAPELDLHSLRHSYITHLVEFDYPERFVSLQAGHEYASTTAIYTNPRELHQPGEIREVCPGTKGCNEVPAARHDSFVTWDYARTSPPDARFPRQPGKIMRTAGPSRARPTCPGPARAHGANPRVRRPGRLEEHQRGDASGPAGADQLRAFRGLEYPSPPLGISDEYRDRLVKRALKNRNPNLWEAQ